MIEVTVFLDEDDQYQGKSMPEYIMRYLMHHGIRGASAFTAVMGYGRKHHLHYTRGIGRVDEGPMMIVFIDEDARVREVLPHLREILKDGLIVCKTVDNG